MNCDSYDTLRSMIDYASKLAIIENTWKVIIFDESSSWCIHSCDKKDRHQEGIFVNGDGVVYVQGERYQMLREKMQKQARMAMFTLT